jgi:hypothetical protein
MESDQVKSFSGPLPVWYKFVPFHGLLPGSRGEMR